MKKLNKKAFTIVELVVVIAVIAILAAVLIPTFASLIRKSKVSKDTQLIRNLNTALADDKVTNQHNTMTDALAAADKYGYNVAKINASAKENEILWDSKNDVFCYLNEGAIEYLPDSVKDADKLSATDYRLWKIFDKAPAADNNFSIYVASQAAAEYVAANTVNVGVDCGEYVFANVTYVNGTGARRDVTFRTAEGGLSVDGYVGETEGDVIKHYGILDEVDIIKCYTASYHEYGIVRSKVSIAQGRIVVEESGEVPAVEITAADKDIKIETPKSIVVSASANVVAALGAAKLDKVAVKVTTETAKVVVDEKVDTAKVEINGQAATEETLVQITKVSNLTELNAALVGNKDYIMLTDDITVNSALNVCISTTIDGDGHTITGSWRRGSTSNYPTIGINYNQTSVMTDVTIKNVKIVNNASGSVSGRPIETRGKLNSLTLINVDAESKTCSGYRQALTIGGSQASVAKVTLDNCNFSNGASNGYSIVTFNPVDMTINGSTFEAWAAVYLKGPDGSYGSAGSTVVANNCEFNCANKHNGTSNEFGAIVFEDGNVQFSANSCVFDVTQYGDQPQSAILFNVYWTEGELDNVVVSLHDVQINGDINNEEVKYNATNVLRIYDGQTVKDPSRYAAEGSQVVKEGALYVIRSYAD